MAIKLDKALNGVTSGALTEKINGVGRSIDTNLVVRGQGLYPLCTPARPAPARTMARQRASPPFQLPCMTCLAHPINQDFDDARAAVQVTQNGSSTCSSSSSVQAVCGWPETGLKRRGRQHTIQKITRTETTKRDGGHGSRMGSFEVEFQY